MAAPLVLGVGEGRDTEEFTERSAGCSGQSLVLIERKQHDVAGIVMDQLRTIDEGASNDIAERALRQMKRPAE